MLNDIEATRREKQTEIDRVRTQVGEESARKERLVEERAQLEQSVCTLRKERDLLEEQVRIASDKMLLHKK